MAFTTNGNGNSNGWGNDNGSGPVGGGEGNGNCPAGGGGGWSSGNGRGSTGHVIDWRLRVTTAAAAEAAAAVAAAVAVAEAAAAVAAGAAAAAGGQGPPPFIIVKIGRHLVADLRHQGMADSDVRAALKERGYKKARISQLMKAAGKPDKRGNGISAPTVRRNPAAADDPAPTSGASRTVEPDEETEAA
jgi:hypothetical protein